MTQVYNGAINRVLTDQGYPPFHQSGVTLDGAHEPGYHGWELLSAPRDLERATIEGWIEKIHEHARRAFAQW